MEVADAFIDELNSVLCFEETGIQYGQWSFYLSEKSRKSKAHVPLERVLEKDRVWGVCVLRAEDLREMSESWASKLLCDLLQVDRGKQEERAENNGWCFLFFYSLIFFWPEEKEEP